MCTCILQYSNTPLEDVQSQFYLLRCSWKVTEDCWVPPLYKFSRFWSNNLPLLWWGDKREWRSCFEKPLLSLLNFNKHHPASPAEKTLFQMHELIPLWALSNKEARFLEGQKFTPAFSYFTLWNISQNFQQTVLGFSKKEGCGARLPGLIVRMELPLESHARFCARHTLKKSHDENIPTSVPLTLLFGFFPWTVIFSAFIFTSQKHNRFMSPFSLSKKL